MRINVLVSMTKLKEIPSFIYFAIYCISTVKYMGAVVEWLMPLDIDPTP